MRRLIAFLLSIGLVGILLGCAKKATPPASSLPRDAGKAAAPAANQAPAANPMPSVESATPAWSPSKIAGPATRAAGKAGQEAPATSGESEGQ